MLQVEVCGPGSRQGTLGHGSESAAWVLCVCVCEGFLRAWA